MRKFIGSAVLALMVMGAASTANAVVIISTAKLGVVTDPNGHSVGGSDLQAIARHSAWQVNNPLGRGAVWVSNAATGIAPDATFQTRAFTNDANADVIFRITETFSITRISDIDFSIWADDTARLFLDGVLLKDWNTSQGTCAVGSIGCEPTEDFTFSQQLAAGNHTIEIDTYQIGTGATNSSNPFGVLYSGTVIAVPEPTTLGILGAGLLGLGFAGRRRARKVRRRIA